jgi:hypothetical protein
MEGSEEAALKYLELARNEILEKVRFVNQTLAAYLLGVSALSSWIYQTISRTNPPMDPAEKAVVILGFALLLAYVSLGANWLIHHNERVVSALAIYQRDELVRYLPGGPKSWENSRSLKDKDGRWHAMGTILVEEIILLGPSWYAYFYARSLEGLAAGWTGGLWHVPVHVWLSAARVVNWLNVGIALLMFWTRWKLRDKS